MYNRTKYAKMEIGRALEAGGWTDDYVRTMHGWMSLFDRRIGDNGLSTLRIERCVSE